MKIEKIEYRCDLCGMPCESNSTVVWNGTEFSHVVLTGVDLNIPKERGARFHQRNLDLCKDHLNALAEFING